MVERRRGWTQKETQFVKDNYGVLTLHQISSHLGRSYPSIAKKVRRLKLDDPRKWTEEEDKLLVENYEYNPQVWELFPNRSHDAVKTRASQTFKLQRKTGNCPVDYKFFDKMSEYSAYTLGFFTADGCIERRPQIGSRISFSQRIEDVDILYKIRKAMKSTSPLCFKRTRNEVTLYYHNAYLVDRLFEMGFDSNKSMTAEIPSCITDEWMPAYLRGLLDGDGSVVTKNRFRVYFLGTYKLLAAVRRYFISKGLSSKPNVIKRPKVSVHCLAYNEKDLKTLCELLYSNSNIHLDRKYQKAMYMLSSLGGFTRGESPRKINSAQIGEPLLGNAKGNPEGKTQK